MIVTLICQRIALDRTEDLGGPFAFNIQHSSEQGQTKRHSKLLYSFVPIAQRTQPRKWAKSWLFSLMLRQRRPRPLPRQRQQSLRVWISVNWLYVRLSLFHRPSSLPAQYSPNAHAKPSTANVSKTSPGASGLHPAGHPTHSTNSSQISTETNCCAIPEQRNQNQ